MPEEPAELAKRNAEAHALYVEYRGTLLHIARDRFHIPHSDAEALTHDVFLTHLRRAPEIRMLRPWFIWAIVHASQAWWRDRKRQEPYPPNFEEWIDERTEVLAQRIEDDLTLKQLVAKTPKRCHQLLSYRYDEGMTIAEIAKELSTTANYARKLVFGCVTRLRELCRKKAVA